MNTSLAIVRTATGRVVTFVRADVPVGWKPPVGCTAKSPAELPVDWQYEEQIAEPVADTLAGVPVTATGDTLTIPARILAPSDIQVPDPDRGLLLRDDAGNDWLVAISNGAVTAVQVSASPECSLSVRKTRIAAARASYKSLLTANKGKGKSKLTEKERLDAIEALLGIVYPA